MPREEGGARGSEIVKLCLGCARRRAALALPGARARERGGARPRARARASPVRIGARVAERRALGARTRRSRGADGPRLHAGSAAAAPSRSSASRGRGRVCARESERSGWVGAARGPAGGGGGAARSSSQGRGALARHGYSKPSTSRKRSFLRLGGFCILSSHRWGWRRPTVRATHWEARLGRCGGLRGHPEG